MISNRIPPATNIAELRYHSDFLVYRFRIGELEFELNRGQLRCGDRPVVTLEPRQAHTLIFLMNQGRGKAVSDLEIFAAQGSVASCSQSNRNKNRSEVVKKLRLAAGPDHQHLISNKTLLSKDHAEPKPPELEHAPIPDRESLYQKWRKYGFDHLVNATVIPSVASEAERASAMERRSFEAHASKRLDEIIDDLVVTFPKFDRFFHRINGGPRLPFHLLTDPHALPRFPMKVGPGKDDPSKAQNLVEGATSDQLSPDSLFRQRYHQGSMLYPGTIFSLQSIGEDGWKLGWTYYTEMIDSCDYVQARLREHWQRAFDAQLSSDTIRHLMSGDDESLHPLGEVAQMWWERAGSVTVGRFSDYLAAIAFSIPMFRICDNGRLQLLCAEGSLQKQAGAGQKHVCPAGMLEFFSRKGPGTSLSLEDFRTYVAKELLEETCFGSKFKLKPGSEFERQVSAFSTDMPGKLDSSPTELRATLQDVILPHWDEIWADFPDIQSRIATGNRKGIPSRTPLEMVLNMRAPDGTPDNPWFVIVDALCFRPEIIKPLYLREELGALLNWEYKYEDKGPSSKEDALFEIVEFTSEAQVEQWVQDNRRDWCAPGLAAAYLGAVHYFRNKNSFG